MKRWAKYTAAVALLAALPATQASPVTVGFIGNVTNVYDGGSGTFGDYFHVGQPFSGSWTFDSEAVGIPLGLGRTDYTASFQVTIGSLTFSGGANYSIYDESPVADGFMVRSNGTFAILPTDVPFRSADFYIAFEMMPNSTLSSQNLVLDPAAIALLGEQHSGLVLIGPAGSTNELLLATTLVPLPPAIALLGGGLALTGLFPRRRGHRSLASSNQSSF